MKARVVCLLLLAVLFGGCYSTPTFVEPEIGWYHFSQAGHFRVFEGDYLKIKFISFSRDGYRYDAIPVVAGAFFRQWGQRGGTHCPTDAYILSGHFTSPTTAEGYIRYGSNCMFGLPHCFTAEFGK